MQNTFVTSLNTLSAWRRTLDREVVAYVKRLADEELLDEADGELLSALHQKLAADKLVLAFVAEYSRGKSELINALFFGDTGQRILPATPGRTTMCPVELQFQAGVPARLSLLPIDTRREMPSLAQWREEDKAWTHLPLNPADPAAMAQTMQALTHTRQVSVEDARALGLWRDDETQDNPPLDEAGQVQVPRWRHALINYPHPLLRRGLVVIDTPGLNAVGTEAELTLNLLPSAHASVFVLAADTGVTKSDLNVWREHLSGPSSEAFVVLNKIDTLADPLRSGDEIDAQIAHQCEEAARALGIEAHRAFAVSARLALNARIQGDAAALQHSRLGALEQALSEQLLPRQRELLAQATRHTVGVLRKASMRRLAQRRMHAAEQTQELRALRGKSAGRLQVMLNRVDAEAAGFEACTARLAALRSVQRRLLRQALGVLSTDAVREEVAAMHAAVGASPFNLGAGKAFAALCARLRAALVSARQQCAEMQLMFDASFQQLNAEFGFSFQPTGQPDLARFERELGVLETNYSRYLGPTQAWRLARPGFVEQFRRMLLSRLRVVFESSSGEVELWSKAAAAQVDRQLRERRDFFARRREALVRVRDAAGELEERIEQVQAQEAQGAQLQRDLDAAADELLRRADEDGPALRTDAAALRRDAA